MPVIFSRGDKLDNGHYTVTQEIGVGGMGVVYLCKDEMLLRDVAIKMLLPELMKDKSSFEVFRQEARLAAQLEHPNIVTVFDIGVEDRQNKSHHYVVMEYLPGGNLESRVCDGPMPTEHCLSWMKQLASGLTFAHKRGVVHQDIKADNIFITNEGDLKIGDFGLARLLVSRAHLNAVNKGMGTPAYMSPELCRGDSQDHRSDIYSLGVLFFEMATGKLPFRAKGMIEMAMKHSIAPIPSARRVNPLVPEILDKLIRRMMAKAPEERFQNTSEVLTILDDLIFELRVARLGIGNRPFMRSGPVNSQASQSAAVETSTYLLALPENAIQRTQKPTEAKPKASSKEEESNSKQAVHAIEKSKKPKDSADKATIATHAPKIQAALKPAFDLKWSFKCKGPIGWTSGPVLDRDEKVVYVSSTDGRLYAINALDGTLIWACDTHGPILSSPLLCNDKLIQTNALGHVFAISTKDGKTEWQVSTGEKLVSTPVFHKDLLIVPSLTGKLLALDIGQGRRKWQFDAGGPIVCSAQRHEELVLFGTRTNKFHAVSIDNGLQVWSYKTDGPIVASPTASVDSVYFGSQAGTFYALEADTGSLIWEYPTNGAIVSKGVIAFTSVVFCSRDRWMYCCEKYDGSLMWKVAIKGRVLANLVASRGTATCVTREGWLNAYNSRTGAVQWQKDLRHQFESAPLISSDTLFIGTVEGELLAYSLEAKSLAREKTA
jgi:serine/threonine protein kinase